MDEPRVLQIAERRARVLDSGVGKTVIVLHGWGGRIESMAPVIQCLAPRFRVVALDLPGFGESPRPEEVWGTPEYAAFLRAVMGDLGIERAHIVGHSYGAKAGLQLAATHPELVEKLVAVGSSGLRSAPSLRTRSKRFVGRLARAAGKLGPPGEAIRNAVYRKVASSDYRDAGEMRPTLVRVVNEDLSGLLTRIQASTLLVWGANDDAVPLAHARRMEKLIPDAGLVIFEGAGHFAYLDEPERFCRVIRHFLAGSSSIS